MTITRIDLHGQALPPGAVYCGRPMRPRRLRDGSAERSGIGLLVPGGSGVPL